MHCCHGDGYIGTWSSEDLFVPHPVESIVEVTWLDPYASCLLVCFGFDLSVIKPVNIACFARGPFLFCFTNRWRFVIVDNMDQIPSSWRERWELREPRGVVWDIQIVLDAFIFVMLKLGVDRCIRCDARRGAGVALLDCVDGSFLIIFSPDHVDEVVRLRPRSVHKTQIQAAL